jgi:2-dehydropantoate 2-reductase
MVERHPAFEPWLATFSAAGLPIEARTDMPGVQAAKLLLNLNNAINALSNLTLREELGIRPYRRSLALAQREALRVMRAAGLRPSRLTVLPPGWFPRMLGAPDVLFERLAQRVLAIDPLARSSTWEDLAAGRPTEVDFINGEVVRMAQAHGLDAPVNARLVALVEAAERGERRVWRGADLWAELKAARSRG